MLPVNENAEATTDLSTHDPSYDPCLKISDNNDPDLVIPDNYTDKIDEQPDERDFMCDDMRRQFAESYLKGSRDATATTDDTIAAVHRRDPDCSRDAPDLLAATLLALQTAFPNLTKVQREAVWQMVTTTHKITALAAGVQPVPNLSPSPDTQFDRLTQSFNDCLEIEELVLCPDVDCKTPHHREDLKDGGLCRHCSSPIRIPPPPVRNDESADEDGAGPTHDARRPRDHYHESLAFLPVSEQLRFMISQSHELRQAILDWQTNSCLCFHHFQSHCRHGGVPVCG